MASILLLTDFSAASLNAAAYGVQLFGRTGNVFTLLHSYMVPVSADPLMMSTAIPDVDLPATREMTAFIARLKDRLAMPELVLGHEMVVGTLPSSISILNNGSSLDVLVMGAGSTTGTDEWFFGSDVAAVIKHVRLPAVIVPERAVYSDVKHVLLASDGGDLVPGTLHLLLDVLRRNHARVTVVQVESPTEPSTSVNPDPMFHALFGDLQHTFLTVQGEEVAEAIDQQATANKADLVALLHRHLAPVQSWFHRSTAKQLALRTHVPLLVLQQ